MSDPTYPSSLTRSFIEVLGKHLPPEPSALRLADVGSRAGLVLGDMRPELEIVPVTGPVDTWALAPGSVDVVAAYDMRLGPLFMQTALAALRPGGRLIVVNPIGETHPSLVHLLEDAGFTRIFVEPALELPHPAGVLLRGEKPGSEPSGRDVPEIWRTAIPVAQRQERFIHLLICQTVVTAEENNTLIWQAAAVAGDDETVLLAFSSLGKAIQFMQPGVVTGRIRDVNKIAKFNWSVTKAWPQPFMLNPTDDILESFQLVFVPVDPATAETVD
jgi:hypothetical protein